MPLGAFIRRTRGALGLTQTDIVRRMQLAGNPIDRSYLSQIEKGIRTPSSDVLAVLAQALEIPVMKLLEEAGTIPEDERDQVSDAELARLLRGMSAAGRSVVIATAKAIRESENKYKVER